MNDPVDPRGVPATPPPATPDASDEQVTEQDLREGTIDFNYAVKPDGGSGGAGKLHKMSEPLSGGSVISWAELLRQQQRQSNDEVVVGSLPEIQIDAISDKDLVKHLEREAQGPTRNAPLTPAPAPANPPSTVVPPMPSGSSMASKLFKRDAAKADDWLLEAPKFDTSQQSSSIDLRTAARAANAANSSDSNVHGEESDVLMHALHSEDGNSAVNLGMEPRISGLVSNPSVLEGVARMAATVDAPSGGSSPSNARMGRRQPQPLLSWLGAAALGLAAGSGLALGVWYGKRMTQTSGQTVSLVQPGTPDTAPTVPTTPVAPAVTIESARKLLETGDTENALAAFTELPDNAETRLGRGQARWLAYLRQQRLQKQAPNEAAQAVADARRDLTTANVPESFVWLGLMNETLGQTDAARETYRNGLNQFPDKAKLFHAALSRLDALSSRKGKPAVTRAAPELGMALSLILINAAGEAVNEEAGFDYWQAISLARQQKFGPAREALAKAMAVHDERRNTLTRQGLNPTSDPREDIFLYNCDQLLAYWDVQAKLNSGGYPFDEGNAGEAITSLLTSHKRVDDAVKAVSSKLKTDKPEEMSAALDALIVARQQAESESKQAQKALRMAEVGVSRSEEALSAFKKEAAEQAKLALAKLEEATTRETAARKAVADLTAARKDADEALQKIAAKLRAAKLVGDNARTQDILTAIDTVLTERAALAAKANVRPTPKTTPAPVVEKPDPELAERAFSAGIRLYFAHQYEQAEVELQTALKNNQQDARILYFLGLSRLPLGKVDAAQQDFRTAAALEKLGLPDAATVNLMFERIQGPERQFLNRFRK